MSDCSRHYEVLGGRIAVTDQLEENGALIALAFMVPLAAGYLSGRVAVVGGAATRVRDSRMRSATEVARLVASGPARAQMEELGAEPSVFYIELMPGAGEPGGGAPGGDG